MEWSAFNEGTELAASFFSLIGSSHLGLGQPTVIIHAHGSGTVVLAGEFGCADTVIIHLGRPT